MENNIGVGAIVGLATVSSFYIYNSSKFNSVQKTILLICVLFPPVQWIGILIVLAYNNYFENNSVDKVIQRKTEQKTNTLNSQVENLKDLKEKGILSEEEFKSKVEKIEVEKIENNIKNTQDYKQLNSLFENGILTKDEFESKIKLIIQDRDNVSETKTYINQLAFDKISDEVISNDIHKKNKNYLKKLAPYSILLFLFFASVVILNNYKNTKKTENNSEVSLVDSTIVIDTNYNYNKIKNELKLKKFVYVVMKVSKPRLDIFQSSVTETSLTGFEVYPEPLYSIEYETGEYITDIIEINNYNEDEKYKIIDNAKKEMDFEMSRIDDLYRSNLMLDCKDSEKRKQFFKKRCKIIDAQIKVFDSYSQASINKDKN